MKHKRDEVKVERILGLPVACPLCFLLLIILKTSLGNGFDVRFRTDQCPGDDVQIFPAVAFSIRVWC